MRAEVCVDIVTVLVFVVGEGNSGNDFVKRGVALNIVIDLLAEAVELDAVAWVIEGFILALAVS